MTKYRWPAASASGIKLRDKQLVVQSDIGRLDLEDEVRVNSDGYAPGLESKLKLILQALTVIVIAS